MTPRASAFCKLLGIRYPIVQAGMSRVAGAELVAEVSRAGGLGVLAALRLEPENLRQEIHRIRRLTDRPFGVNQWLHPAIVNPISPESVGDPALAFVQQKLNEFRARLGMQPSTKRPGPFPDLVQRSIEVIIEERVPVWSIGLGAPDVEVVRRCHDRGIRVMAMVTNTQDARTVSALGVDVVVAQGVEAGGHRSNWEPRHNEAGTMALVPSVVAAIPQPVVAAGGIADGRGLVAALALGASGVLMGTRFIAARESIAPQFFKDSVVAADVGDTLVTSAFTGLPMRGLRNTFALDYEGAPVLPPMLQSNAAEDIFRTAAERGDREHFPMPAGETAGLVSDAPAAGEIVRTIVNEAEAVIRGLKRAKAPAAAPRRRAKKA
jgi:nitronate monooxygenase